MNTPSTDRKTIRDLAEANRATPDHPDTLRELGKRLKARGRFEEAFLHFENMRLISEGDPERRDHLRSALFHGGECLLRLSGYKEAAAWFDRCLEIAPDHHAAAALRAEADRKKGGLERPADSFEADRGRNEVRILRRCCAQWREKALKPAAWELYPPGHYFSPHADLGELKRDEARLFGQRPREFAGIDLNRAGQLALLRRFPAYYRDMPFPIHVTPGFRYHLNNPTYTYADGIVLYCMMRHFKPRNLIEVGSGNSSCLILDTNERFFSNRIACTFIDPYPQYVRSLLSAEDLVKTSILPARLQDMNLRSLSRLGRNDILFIDGSHVSKIGSDVNFLFFDVLPRLKPGVLVHIHDIFYPFEYPRSWILEGRAWSELYLLRAFLQYNRAFKIVFFTTYLEHFFEAFFQKHMPLCLKNRGGSIWLRKEGRED